MGERPTPPRPAAAPPMHQNPSGLLVPPEIAKEKAEAAAVAAVDICPLMSGGPYVVPVAGPGGQPGLSVQVNVVPCIREQCHWWHAGEDPVEDPPGCLIKKGLLATVGVLADIHEAVTDLVNAAENAGALPPPGDAPEAPRPGKAASAVPVVTAADDAAAARAALAAATAADATAGQPRA